MTDLEQAVIQRGERSVCLCKEGICTLFDGRGISPLIEIIEGGTDFSGYSAADIIVGKAAAMLFVKMGVTAVHGRVMSEAARQFLRMKSIPFSFDTLTEKIINRQGNDICPMEKTVSDIDDVETAYTALKNKLAELKGK